MLQLAKEIVAGRRLTAEDDLTRLVTADDGGEILFRSGANATLTGDMLTTVGIYRPGQGNAEPSRLQTKKSQR